MRARRRDYDLHNMPNVYEEVVVQMIRENGYGKRFTPTEIDSLIRHMLDAYYEPLDEICELVEEERWDDVYALAAQEQTRRDLEVLRIARGLVGAP